MRNSNAVIAWYGAMSALSLNTMCAVGREKRAKMRPVSNATLNMLTNDSVVTSALAPTPIGAMWPYPMVATSPR